MQWPQAHYITVTARFIVAVTAGSFLRKRQSTKEIDSARENDLACIKRSMIEKKFISEKVRYKMVQEFIESKLGDAGYSHTEIKKTPMGERIIIFTPSPGLVIGKKGENIRDLTDTLKEKFKLDNPQIEVSEVENVYLDPKSVAKEIVSVFKRFGPSRFKAIGYKFLERIIKAGALGTEIVIAGRGVPSSRAKSWRFSAGYLKKSGDISENYVKRGIVSANLRTGTVGVKVSILTKDVILPDKVRFKEAGETAKIEQIQETVEKTKSQPKQPSRKRKVKNES